MVKLRVEKIFKKDINVIQSVIEHISTVDNECLDCWKRLRKVVICSIVYCGQGCGSGVENIEKLQIFLRSANL